jgi:LPS sulfotransferase NodH
MPAPYLLILAHSRSGSTFLVELVRGMAGVASLAEFFHRDPKSTVADFTEEALAPYGSHAALAEAAITDPLATLAFRDKVDGVSLFVVKVLGQQLRDDRARRILIDNAAGVVVLRRNPFSSWVSRALVDHSKTWTNAGTGKFLVTYDEAFFIRRARGYSTQIRDFLRLVTESGKPFVSITYSDLLALGTPTTLWKFLRAEMPSLPDLRLDPTWKPRVVRQDERLPIDRIDNRNDALASLERLGLGYLVENTDTDDLERLLSALAKKPQGSALDRFISATSRRLGRSAKK